MRITLTTGRKPLQISRSRIDRKQATVLAIALFAFVASPVGATVLFNDGGIHDITAPLGDSAAVSNATTVNFLSGSSVAGADSTVIGGTGVDTGDNSTITINGGNISGGGATGSAGIGGDGIRSVTGAVNVLDGSVTGGSKAAGSGFGGDAVDIRDTAFTMSGGSIIGGYKDVSGGGIGGNALQMSGGSLLISGGLVQGGSGGAISGDALRLTGVFGTISGGTFTSDGSSLLRAVSTTLDIVGGVFEANRYWYLNTGSIFNVFGTGLSMTGTTSGILSGFLDDGSAINVNYYLSDGSVINLNPEPMSVSAPGTLLLFLASMAPLFLGRRRKDRVTL